MATEIRAYTVTIPAGTLPTAPAQLDVSFPAMITDAIEWHQPRGAQGLVGWRITSGGAQVLPKNQGAFIITDGQQGTWALEDLHTSGKWEVTGYNTGTFPHSVNVRFHVRPITGAPVQPSPLAWLLTGRRTTALMQVGILAAAPEAVTVPRAALWPPVRR